MQALKFYRRHFKPRAKLIAQIFFAGLYFFAFYLSISACTNLRTISSRNPGLSDQKDLKQGSNLALPESAKAKPENLYTKKPEVQIKPKRKNTSGSLYQVENESNYLFTMRAPDTISNSVEVLVVLTSKQTLSSTDSAQNAAPGAPAANNPTQTGTQTHDEILSQFPDLKPQDPNQNSVLKSFKMQIEDRYENGDLAVVYHRASESTAEVNSVFVRARVPAAKIQEGKPISTSDLSQVHFVQTSSQETIERESSDWENEYSLRMSGFKESASQAAKDLENKRKELVKVKDKLYQGVINLGKERDQLTKDRQKMNDDRKKDQETIENLQNQISTQNLDENKTQLSTVSDVNLVNTSNNTNTKTSTTTDTKAK